MLSVLLVIAVSVAVFTVCADNIVQLIKAVDVPPFEKTGRGSSVDCETAYGLSYTEIDTYVRYIILWRFG